MITRIDVRPAPNGPVHQGLLSFGGRTIRCAIGRSGITSKKREGDGATPRGQFRVLYGLFRRDRVPRKASGLAISAISPFHGWCDEPSSPNYNQPIKLPFDGSHEKLLREDHLYDVCIVLDYNLHPRCRNLGSAIFFHLAKPGFLPTEGCVAIKRNDMLSLLPHLSDRTVLQVH